MTDPLDDFFARLAQTPRTWGLLRSMGGKGKRELIRCGNGTTCPLQAVPDNRLPTFAPWPQVTRGDIMMVADEYCGCPTSGAPALRARLLAACELTEAV